ncbi:MAG: hypothetical protein R2843_00540 [Thermomicrobiales bacterium]
MDPITQRNLVRDRLIEHAKADPDVTGAALVGSTASGGGDRWSDLDLTFGVAPDRGVDAVLSAWTSWVVAEFGAAVLFDLPIPGTIYRVFLLPGALQVDLSFSEQGVFGKRGPGSSCCLASRSSTRIRRSISRCRTRSVGACIT